MKKHFIIAIDGSDCIGKTTFLYNFLDNIDYVLNVSKNNKSLYIFLKNIKNNYLISKKSIYSNQKQEYIKTKIIELGLFYNKIDFIGDSIIIHLKEGSNKYFEFEYINFYKNKNFFNYLIFFLLIRQKMFKSINKINLFFKEYNLLYLFDRSFISTLVFQFYIPFFYINKLLINKFYHFNNIIQSNILQDLIIILMVIKDIKLTFKFVYNNLLNNNFQDTNYKKNILFRNNLFLKHKKKLIKQIEGFYFMYLFFKNKVNIKLLNPVFYKKDEN